MVVVVVRSGCSCESGLWHVYVVCGMDKSGCWVVGSTAGAAAPGMMP